MDILEFQYRYVVQIGAFVVVALWALRQGDGPEKASALTFAALGLVDRLYHFLVTPAFELESVDYWHFSLDIAVLAVIVPIALRANRIYPLLLAAFQLIAVNSHIARDAFTQITPLAYSLTYVLPSYAQLAILTFGVWAHVRRVKRFGPYRAWRQVPKPG